MSWELQMVLEIFLEKTLKSKCSNCLFKKGDEFHLPLNFPNICIGVSQRGERSTRTSA